MEIEDFLKEMERLKKRELKQKIVLMVISLSLVIILIYLILTYYDKELLFILLIPWYVINLENSIK